MSIELEKTSSSSSSLNLPPEIIETILSKLPSKSLLRFKTVSKSWNTMISDPVFARIHLQSSKNSPNNLMHRYTETGISLFKFEGGKFHTEAVLENPYGSRGKVLCECNGVLLLTKDDVKDDRCCRYMEYALWNRSTRMEAYFAFPHMIYRMLRQFYSLAQGMCYDPITDEFKVVFIDKLYSYRIYSCKNNSWTVKNGIGLFYGCMMDSGIFVDGAIYWVLMESENMNLSEELVYFNPRTDELKRLQKPEKINGHNNEAFVEVASLRDSLCLYCYTKDDGKTNIRLWIKEKGILENPNWEVFVIIESILLGPSSWLRLLCFVGNKIVIRLDEKRYVYYSPCEKKIEEVKEGDDEFWGAFVVPYLDSLLFPTGVTKTIADSSFDFCTCRRRKPIVALICAGVEEAD